jgi:hypothetical protein
MVWVSATEGIEYNPYNAWTIYFTVFPDGGTLFNEFVQFARRTYPNSDPICDQQTGPGLGASWGTPGPWVMIPGRMTCLPEKG